MKQESCRAQRTRKYVCLQVLLSFSMKEYELGVDRSSKFSRQVRNSQVCINFKDITKKFLPVIST